VEENLELEQLAVLTALWLDVVEELPVVLHQLVFVMLAGS
jgi:hypothetical protein